MCMLKLKNIEKTFLLVLQEAADQNDVNKKIAEFSDADWQRLYELSVKTGLFPALCKKLLRLKAQNIPPAFLSQLKNLYLINLRRNIILEQELFKVLAYFREANIPVAPLKGPVLARYIYGDIALRRAPCDLDLLVKREDFEDAEKILSMAGYQTGFKNRTVFQRNYEMKYSGQLQFINKDPAGNNLLIEAHLDIRGLFVYPPLEDFWQGLQEVDIDGNKVLLPSNENLLIYLSLLAMTITEFVELRYLYDISSFINKFEGKIDYKRVMEKIRHTRHKACVYSALTLARHFFDFGIPEFFLNQLRPNFVKRVFLSIWINKKNVLHKRPARSRDWYYFFTAWHYFATSWLYSENIFDCFRIIYRKIFLPKGEMRGLYTKSSSDISLYLKRMLRPVTRLLKIENAVDLRRGIG